MATKLLRSKISDEDCNKKEVVWLRKKFKLLENSWFRTLDKQ